MKIEDKPYLSRQKFRDFFKALEELGFEEKNIAQTIKEIKESNSISFLKKKFEGREKVYEYKLNPKSRREKILFVCTSFVDSIDDINEEDYIWIGQKEQGNPIVFFWFPLLRSARFDENALKYVKMFIEVAEHSPFCEECGQELYFDHYPGVMHLMIYVCGNHSYRHERQNHVPYAMFDNVILSDQNSLLMFNRYKQFYENEYTRQLIEPDKIHRSARVERANNKKLAQQKAAMQKNQYGDIRNFDDGFYHEAHIE